VGWQDRDYARWTTEERRRFLGSDAPVAATATRPSTPRPTGTQAAVLAVAVSAALFALGHLPRGHPLVPAFHFNLLARSTVRAQPQSSFQVTEPQVGKLHGPRAARIGSFLTVSGSLPPGTAGSVSVEGTYGHGWQTLVLVSTGASSYTARIPLARRGLLHLRIVYPDGSRSVGSIRVR
jgi:hypothetical protein